jgi:autotransporter-associated beta strand protein
MNTSNPHQQPLQVFLKRLGGITAGFAALPWLVVGAPLPISAQSTVTWDGSTDMDWTQPDSTSWSGSTYNSGDTARFLGDGPGTVTIGAGGVSPGAITVGGTSDYNFTGAAISGAATLTKDGSGVLTLSSTNTYTGLTTVNEGTLEITAIRANGTGALAINGGTLRIATGGFNAFGAPPPAITIEDGGVMIADQATNNAHNLGNLTLNGGRLAPKAVFFNGTKHEPIRWVGNEPGIAPDVNWNSIRSEDLTVVNDSHRASDPDGDTWAPMEADTTLYDHNWFWAPVKETRRKSVDHLLHLFVKSVGNGSLLLLDSSPNTTGLLPEDDVKHCAEFGEAIERNFCHRSLQNGHHPPFPGPPVPTWAFSSGFIPKANF